MSDIDLTRVEEALKRTREGELLRLAARNPMSIPLFVDAAVKAERVKGVEKAVKRALCRQLKARRPGKGYDVVLMEILREYKGASHESLDSLVALGMLERHGFCYDDHRDSLACVEALVSFSTETMEMVRDYGQEAISLTAKALAQMGMRISPGGLEGRITQAADGLVHHMAMGLGWNCRKKNSLATPITTPAVLRATLHILQNQEIVVLSASASGQARILVEATQMVHAVSQRGMTDEQIHALVEDKNPNVLGRACALITDGVVTIDQLPVVMATGLLGRGRQVVMRVLGDWNDLGQSCSLQQFIDLGGNRESWEQYEQAQLQRERERDRLRAEERERADANAPKHRKRGQANCQESETVNVDFGALCSEVNVHVSFADLDQDLTRVILVHGLLREGDRLVSMARLPARKESKLWSQCRPHLGENPSRKAFKRGLQVLISRRLVAISGGKHSLASPSARYPEAQQLLKQLRGLVVKYAS